MPKIQITVGDISLAAELNDSPTSRSVWQALPIQGQANVWGDEIYFEIPVVDDAQPDARAEMDVGEIGYWPVGRAFCVFYGPTPASTDEKPRAASPVNVLGRVTADVSRLKGVRSGAPVIITSAE
jgi:hypothetical protein